MQKTQDKRSISAENTASLAFEAHLQKTGITHKEEDEGEEEWTDVRGMGKSRVLHFSRDTLYVGS